MIRNIVVNKEPRETRIAIVEDGKLAQIFVERDRQIVGSIYKCKVENVISGIDAAFVDIGEEKNAFLYAGDILTDENFDETNKKKNRKAVSIHNLITEGQEKLVQVIKAPRGTKGARVTTKITIPGRYLVVIPNNDTIGISKRIPEQERKRLKQIAEEIRPKNYGLIIRTEAEGISKKDLDHDIKLMVKIYGDIEEKAKKLHAPAIVYKELSLIYQTIRDFLNADVNNLYIDNQEDYRKALTITELFDPKLKNKIKLYKDKQPIFEHFSLENQYMQLFKRKVWLKSGGNICIDHAEALTVIDVNSGKMIGKKNLEETVFATNLEAAAEIAKQIRLRDIGGIIIIDFIDMQNHNYRHQLVQKLGEELKHENTRTTISQVSQLGLIELTRKRVIDAVSETVTQMCPYCNGRGRTENPETVSLRAEREIRNYISQNKCEYGIIINMHPDPALYLLGEDSKNLESLEKNYNMHIYVRGYEDMHIEDIKIIKVTPEMSDALNPLTIGQVYNIRPKQNHLTVKDVAYTWIENIYTEIPFGNKYEGRQVKISIKELSRNKIKAKIKNT
ncbi:MAG: Rne/Rng family ribonuclease [Armatimonadetes bacterium]|nr:Rne/Rng family ribonuclease [Candidatus Hippobium faecium]